MPRWALALLLLAGIGLIYAGHRLGAPKARPNVVFLLLDTVRSDRMHATRNGVPIMPFLDEFSKGGAYFSNAISPASWTKPALASLFTDLYPETHHVRYSAKPGTDESKGLTSDKLAEAFETLAEYLRDAGYDNWGIQTNENGRAEYNMAQGFAPGRYDYIEFMPGNVVTDHALAKLPSMSPPFFLFAQYVDAHGPYTPQENYKTVFGPQPEVSPQDAEIINSPDESFFNKFLLDDNDTWLGRKPARAYPALSDAGKEALRYRYDAECKQLDDQVARLVRTIEGAHPDTIFVIVSDHGEEFWERGTMGHGQHVYQELIHVPLIVRGPGIPVGEVSETVSTMGIWPTLAKALGLPARPQWQKPGLFEQAKNPAPVFAWTRGTYDDGKVNVAAMLDGPLKLINSPIDPKVTPPTHADCELFDLNADPGEKKNVYPRALDQDVPLLAKLERHREAELKAGESISADSVTLSGESKDQLEALGYLDGGKKPQADATPKPEARNEQLEALGYLGGDDKKATPAAPPPPAPRQPNVLLVIVDTLRADRVDAVRNGVPVMPHLKDLAQQSAWFKQAIAQASWTKPSVTSILTGLYTQTHGVEFGVQRPWVEWQHMTVQGLAPEKPTLLAYLKRYDYATAAIQTNVHLQDLYGFGLGCDDYHFAKWANATQVTDQALERAKQLKQPFGLYAHYFDPHADYAPPEPHRSAFGALPPLTPKEETLLHDDYNQKYYLQKAKLDMGLSTEKPTVEFSETGREHVRQLYDGECHYTDEQLARLIESVRKDYPNTIIVVTADHGEEFWEHGGIGHAKTVYQEVIHVPLIISVPGAPARSIDTPVENIDIAPTLAALLQLPAEPHWQGHDALAPTATAHPVFSETRGSFPEAHLKKETVIAGGEKLIRDVTNNVLSLFNLRDDPRETNNLATNANEEVVTLGSLLDQHNAVVNDHPLAKIPPPVFDLEGGKATPDNREQLEALGYLAPTTNTGELTTSP